MSLRPALPEDFAGEVRQTSALCNGYSQANLVVVPQQHAFDFLLFCQRNPRPCPVLEVTDPGDPQPKETAPGADLRTDLPRYRIWRNGEVVEEPTDLLGHWTEDSCPVGSCS